MRSDADQRKIVFRGKVAAGRGQGEYFTQLNWVCTQLSIKFGFEPVAGTFNVKLSSEDEARLETLNGFAGVRITSPDLGFCDAKCFPARIGTISGALVIPLVEKYPHDILEIVAPVKLRQALGVKDNDLVEVYITPVD